MSEDNGAIDGVGDSDQQVETIADSNADVTSDREPAPPIESRFLYVDVAAQRAKQLRRGAVPRLPELAPDPQTGVRPVPKNKLERIAMREVDGQKIYYETKKSLVNSRE